MKRLIKKSELIGTIEKNGEEFQIYDNPIFNDFNTLMANPMGFVNGLIDNNKLYIWNPILTYEEVIEHFGYGNDGTRLTFNYDGITADDSLGYDYTFNNINNVKDIIGNMLSKNEYSINIKLNQNGFSGSLNQFLNGGKVSEEIN